jgi:hypothetical protein
VTGKRKEQGHEHSYGQARANREPGGCWLLDVHQTDNGTRSVRVIPSESFSSRDRLSAFLTLQSC